VLKNGFVTPKVIQSSLQILDNTKQGMDDIFHVQRIPMVLISRGLFSGFHKPTIIY
jgi:hypothetical protein